MAWKFKQIEPQPARGKLVESMWDDPAWYAEEKFDGDRRIAQFCGRVVRFTGRRKSVDGSGFVEKTQNVPHLSAHFNAWSRSGRPVAVRSLVGPNGETISIHPVPLALDGTVLDGEMIVDEVELGDRTDDDVGGGMSKFVTSIMGSLCEEAVRKQIERGWLRYVVFDCLFFKGRDIRGLPQEARKAYAIDAVVAWANPFGSVAASTGVKKHLFYSKVIERGGEGVILKHMDGRYGDKQAWVKVKKQATADCVIMGFKEAKAESKKATGKVSATKYAEAGLIGAVQVGQYRPPDERTPQGVIHKSPPFVEVATISGIDDGLRADMTAHPKKYLGKVVEIEHNGREPTGRFRHPRFGRFRPDKRPEDCVMRKDET